MLIYIDTSSLVKRYIQETGSREIDAIFDEADEIIISAITRVEIHSAFARKLRDGSVSKVTYDKAIMFWKADSESFLTVQLNDSVCGKAVDLIDVHGIKTLDAVQTASALESNPDRIVTSDARMNRILQSLVPEKTRFV